MIPFIVYLLKSTVCLTLFYLFYRLLLSRETFHQLNRYTLLLLMPLSFLLPLVEIEVKSPGSITQMVWNLEEVLIAPQNTIPEPEGSKTPYSTLCLVVYLTGMLIFWTKHLYAMVCLCRLIRQGKNAPDGKGNTLVIHQQDLAPFSWMHYIVISERDLAENATPILLHEQTHIRYHHSWDLLLADICISLQWFNPAVWLFKQDLQNIHEYQADNAVIQQGIDAKTYQLLLIKKAVGTRLYSMANSFYHSTLKKRITMMIKKKSNPWARMKYLYVLPLAAMAVAAFAHPETNMVANKISLDKVSNFQSICPISPTENDTSITGQPKKVYDNHEIDEPARYKDGYMELRKFISQNLHYPTEGYQKKLEGKTLISFVINADGSMSDVEVEKSSHPILDEAALAIVKQIPQRWIPGKQKGKNVKVSFSIPIIFKIP